MIPVMEKAFTVFLVFRFALPKCEINFYVLPMLDSSGKRNFSFRASVESYGYVTQQAGSSEHISSSHTCCYYGFAHILHFYDYSPCTSILCLDSPSFVYLFPLAANHHFAVVTQNILRGEICFALFCTSYDEQIFYSLILRFLSFFFGSFDHNFHSHWMYVVDN